MTLLIILLLVGAGVSIVYSIVLTVKLFKSFGTDLTNDERIDALKKYKKQVIISYAAAAAFITGAALIKIL